MKPVYQFKNLQTNNVLTFSNARLAHEVYKEICRLNDSTFYAYSSFRSILKQKPSFRFLHYQLDRPYLVTNKEFNLGNDLEHLVTSESLYFPKYSPMGRDETED